MMLLLLPPVCFVLFCSVPFNSHLSLCVLIVASCAQTFLAINPILCCFCCCIHSTQTGSGRRFSGTCRSVCVSTTSISKAKTKTSIIIMDFGKMATTIGDAQQNTANAPMVRNPPKWIVNCFISCRTCDYPVLALLPSIFILPASTSSCGFTAANCLQCDYLPEITREWYNN